MFQPAVNQELSIDGVIYRVAEHPYAPGIPYGQEGRAGIVYQVVAESGKRALKEFKPRFQLPSLVGHSRQLGAFASLPGLSVCSRTVLTPQKDALLHTYPDLLYAVVMPWIDGPTWMEVMNTELPLTAEQSLALARGLANILANMEQDGLAHCDLSGPNLILPSLVVAGGGADMSGGVNSPVELVDVEALFGPGLRKPEVLPAGSAGYAHKTAPDGLWVAEADRFAGAVLLAEMLGWSGEEVRAAAWGENYFDPEEMHQDGERYRVLVRALDERWGSEVASLFERAWASQILEDCPPLGAWLLRLAGPARAQETAGLALLPAVPAAGAEIPREEDAEAEAHDEAQSSIRVLMHLAESFESQGNTSSALHAYREARSLATRGSGLAEELALIIADLEQQERAARETAAILVPALSSPTSEPAPPTSPPIPGIAPLMTQEELPGAAAAAPDPVAAQVGTRGASAQVLSGTDQAHAARGERGAIRFVVPAIVVLALVVFGTLALLQLQPGKGGSSGSTGGPAAAATFRLIAEEATAVARDTATAQANIAAQAGADQTATAGTLARTEANATNTAQTVLEGQANATHTSQAQEQANADATIVERAVTAQAETALQATAAAQATASTLNQSMALQQATVQAQQTEIAQAHAQLTQEAASRQAAAQARGTGTAQAARAASAAAARAQETARAAAAAATAEAAARQAAESAARQATEQAAAAGTAVAATAIAAAQATSVAVAAAQTQTAIAEQAASAAAAATAEAAAQATGTAIAAATATMQGQIHVSTAIAQATEHAQRTGTAIAAAAQTALAASVFPSPPRQIAPPDGSIFNNYPRTTTLQWAPLGGAAKYTLEVDCFHCCQTNAWCTEVGQQFLIVPNLYATTYTFDFVGAQPGRWRVWGVNGSGSAGQKSGWWTFTYTR